MIIILSLEEKKEIEDYIFKTYLLHYVFCNNINYTLEQSEQIPQKDNVIYSDKFLSMLSELTRENIETKILSFEAKNNVYKILLYIKHNDKIHCIDEKANRIEIFNRIVRNLNYNYESSNYYKFVISELHKREFNPFLLKKDPDMYNPTVFMNGYVYDIMVWNALNASHEEYIKFVDTIVGNKYFLTTINRFANDIPMMFKDEEICDRVCNILDLNKGNNIVFTAIDNPRFVRDNYSVNKKLTKLKEAYKKF